MNDRLLSVLLESTKLCKICTLMYKYTGQELMNHFAALISSWLGCSASLPSSSLYQVQWASVSDRHVSGCLHVQAVLLSQHYRGGKQLCWGRLSLSKSWLSILGLYNFAYQRYTVYHSTHCNSWECTRTSWIMDNSLTKVNLALHWFSSCFT